MGYLLILDWVLSRDSQGLSERRLLPGPPVARAEYDRRSWERSEGHASVRAGAAAVEGANLLR